MSRHVFSIFFPLVVGTFVWAVPPDSQKEKSPETPAATEKIAAASKEGQQAITGFRKPEGWQIALFAAEPDVANPVAFFVDRLARVFVCESFRQGTGVTDNRNHDQTWLHADLAASTVEDRIAFHQKLLGPKASEFTQHDDRIRLLVDSNGDGISDTSTVFAEGFHQLEDGTGAGVLEHNGDVFFTCIPKLWRLRDKDDDGVAEHREALYDGFGVRVAFRGHDMHGLVIGPDGRLYFSIGDRGYHVKTKAGTFSNPESGAVFRCELDGTNLEVFATGLRNPQELAFDDWGNLFTGDNNSDSGDKARWVNVLEGGDTGWRMMYQYISDRGPFNREKIWHPYSSETPAYVVPPIDNIADGPSGLTYYPGTGLGDEYRNCFLLVDFRGGPGNSGVRLVKVKPKGAFWEIERNEQLLWNLLATDVDFGPDGAIWVSDWVDGWVGEGKGRIYRFFDPAVQQQPIVHQVQQILKEGFREYANAELARMLSHADRRVRFGAQWELAARGRSQEFSATALNAMVKNEIDLDDIDKNDTPVAMSRLHATWGLAQMARTRPDQRNAIVANLGKLLSDGDPYVRGAAAQGIADAGIDADQSKLYEPTLVKLLTDSEPRVCYSAAIACGKLQLASALDNICVMLAENADIDPAIRHAGVMALKGAPDTTRLVQLSKHPARSVRLAAVVALRKRLDPRVAEFLSDSDLGVQVEAARAINDVPELHGAMPLLAQLASQHSAPPPLLHRALNAAFRIGGDANANVIAAAAADSNTTESMRMEALDMLRAWGSPGKLDRVMNRYMPLEDRDPLAARNALASKLNECMQGSESLRSRALSVAADLSVREAAPFLKETAIDDKLSPDARVTALESMLRLDSTEAAPLLRTLIADGVPALRAAALRGLAPIDTRAALPLLRKAIASDEVIERQSAWDTLAKIDDPMAVELISAGLLEYRQGRLPADVWMNVIEASEGRVSQEEQAALAAFEKQEAETDPLASYRDCIAGGDAKRGEEIFMTRAELSCVRCHKVGNKGGEVGPALDEIAKTKDSRYLLEAIVNPDAKIAENFETTNILTEDDQVISGIVKSENDDQVTLMTPDGKRIDIPKNTITLRKKGKSSMPSDLIKHMNRRQLRDLVAYLSSLKEPPRRGRVRNR